MKRPGYKSIRQGMRRNEVQLLRYLRTHRVYMTALFGMAWLNALERLEAAGMVKYSQRAGLFVVRRGGRPVTAAVR